MSDPTGLLTDRIPGVSVYRVATRHGERLEIAAGDESISLDALALEALSWQDPEALAAGSVAPRRRGRAPEGGGRPAEEGSGDAVEFRNEYAVAIVRPDPERGRLSVSAPKLGYHVELGPEALAALAARDADVIYEFLAHPFGPDQ